VKGCTTSLHGSLFHSTQRYAPWRRSATQQNRFRKGGRSREKNRVERYTQHFKRGGYLSGLRVGRLITPRAKAETDRQGPNEKGLYSDGVGIRIRLNRSCIRLGQLSWEKEREEALRTASVTRNRSPQRGVLSAGETFAGPM